MGVLIVEHVTQTWVLPKSHLRL